MQPELVTNSTFQIELLNFLLDFVSDNKKQKFNQVIQSRTRHITIVLENIFQSHNASAVLRSCDCYGIQDVHIIEGKTPFSINPDIALGASKWLSIHRYPNENATAQCIHSLKENDYYVVATSPHHDAWDLTTLPLNKKVALLFGTEMDGLSAEALSLADTTMKIPMVGFTESLNISVSAAICLFYLSQKIRSMDINWRLSTVEETDVLTSWAKSVVKKSDLLEKQFAEGWLKGKLNG